VSNPCIYLYFYTVDCILLSILFGNFFAGGCLGRTETRKKGIM